MSADNFFDHLEEGGLSAILTSLTSSTPLSSAVANKGEVVKALFVCILCNPISDGERPKLRIYDSNSSCVQEIGLEMSERDHRVFTCFVSARPFENLCCKVAVTLRDGNYCKENVKHDQQIYSRPAFRNYQFHSKDGLIFAAVVRDLFVSKYTRFNHIGTIEEAFRGWVGLLGWIITYFGEQYHNWAECIHAIPDDLKFHAGDQLHSNRYTCLPLVDLLEVLTLDGPRSGPYIGSAGFLSVTELKSRKKCRNLATLLKWIWLADYTAVKTHVKLVADSAAFEAIEHLDVTEVYEAILAASEFSPDFLLAAKTFMSLLVDATSYYTTVRWAMLRVALSPDYQAKNVIRSYHRGAVPYLALFLHPSVSPNTTIAVFSVFPNLRVFRSLQSGEYVLPADVVTNICGPYYQPPNDPEGGIEEYQALQHFVLKNEKLIFKFFKSFKHLSVDSAALDSLTTQDRAEIALMPLIQRLADFPVSEPTARQQVEELVTQRCRILRIYLQPSTLYADALFVKMLYNILRELLKYQRVPGVLEAVRDLSTALPAANCVGLIYRFAAYLKEECAELAALECEVFQIICRKPENDPVSMRKPFWEVLPKVLKVGDTGMENSSVYNF